MTPRRTAARTILMLASLIASAGCGRTPPAAEPDAAGANATERVVAGHPERKTLTLSTMQPGRIEAFEETPLYAKVAGFVDNVLVDIGDVVQKDQTLVKLSIPELVDDLEQKEALVAQAEAEVKQALSAIEASIAAAQTAESRISEAKAAIDRSEADHQRWISEHSRIEDLAAKGSVTKKLEEETRAQMQSAEAAMREAVAKAESSRAVYLEAQANVGKARADHGAAEARLRVAKADLARATTMLAYSEIKAPFDGTVTRRSVDTGHYVHPATAGGDEPLFVVARTDMVRIFVEVPEMEASYVNTGDPALVKIQALEAKSFDAEVVRTSWSLLEANHSLRAEVDVANPRGLLRPGMYASVTIRLDERPDVLSLPATAIVREGNDTSCMLVESGKVARHPVQLGLRSGSDVEIVSGLDQNAVVVLTQPGILQPGQPVQVTPQAK